MAISYTHYLLLSKLAQSGCIKRGGALLEIGQAEFYGDWDAGEFADVPALYRSLFAPSRIVSVDMGGDASALKVDLNEPQSFCEFDLCINHGTAEHVFDIARVFRTIHESTVAGGLMIHECPFTGWTDHGFYCPQPTLFWDLSHANGYQVMFFALEHLQSGTFAMIGCREEVLELKRRGQLADGLMIYAALRKVADGDFRKPIQGVYAGTVSEAVARAWKELR